MLLLVVVNFLEVHYGKLIVVCRHHSCSVPQVIIVTCMVDGEGSASPYWAEGATASSLASTVWHLCGGEWGPCPQRSTPLRTHVQCCPGLIGLHANLWRDFWSSGHSSGPCGSKTWVRKKVAAHCATVGDPPPNPEMGLDFPH